jgi:hypothetical protein
MKHEIQPFAFTRTRDGASVVSNEIRDKLTKQNFETALKLHCCYMNTCRSWLSQQFLASVLEGFGIRALSVRKYQRRLRKSQF